MKGRLDKDKIKELLNYTTKYPAGQTEYYKDLLRKMEELTDS